jgi:hypothetical protein
METARWNLTDTPPTYWAYQLKKIRNASPWVLVIGFLPLVLWLIALLLTGKATLTPLPFIFLGWIPLFIREMPRKLVLPAELDALYYENQTEAIPISVTITNDGELIGEDEGIAYVQDGALIFQGIRCRFVLYNDMIDTAPDKEGADSPEIANIVLNVAAETLKIRIRQRTYENVSSDSDRLRRVLKQWRDGTSERTIEPCIPPIEPTPEAKFSVNSAIVWTCLSIVWLFASWLLTIRGLRSNAADDALPLVTLYLIALACTVGFGWLAIYGAKLALKRAEFYARFEELKPVRP